MVPIQCEVEVIYYITFTSFALIQCEVEVTYQVIMSHSPHLHLISEPFALFCKQICGQERCVHFIGVGRWFSIGWPIQCLIWVVSLYRGDQVHELSQLCKSTQVCHGDTKLGCHLCASRTPVLAQHLQCTHDTFQCDHSTKVCYGDTLVVLLQHLILVLCEQDTPVFTV